MITIERSSCDILPSLLTYFVFLVEGNFFTSQQTIQKYNDVATWNFKKGMAPVFNESETEIAGTLMMSTAQILAGYDVCAGNVRIVFISDPKRVTASYTTSVSNLACDLNCFYPYFFCFSALSVAKVDKNQGKWTISIFAAFPFYFQTLIIIFIIIIITIIIIIIIIIAPSF